MALGVVFVIAIGCAIWLVRGGADAKPLPGQPLRTLAKAKGLEIGTAVRGDQARKNRAYRQTIAAQFSSVTPGITGLWQVSGRSELDFDDLVRLDFLYLERWSVFLDLSILVKTVPAVFTRRGAF